METTEGVANFFIQKSLDTQRGDLTQLKLQKLVYFAHGWHLGLTKGTPLFQEPVQAWRYGPVIQSLRREFKHFGTSPITAKARDIRFVDGKFEEYDHALKDDAAMSPFLSRIWDIYGKFSAVQLTNLTHEPGTPWHKIAVHYQFQIPEGITIPNDLIQQHFQNLAAKTAA